MSATVTLCYHAVSDDWPSSLAVTPTGLERQLRHWLRRGYRPATFTDGVLTPPQGKRLIVTFDDAFASVIEHAFPVLERLGVTATVFVPTLFPNKHGLYWDGIDEWRDGPHATELRCMSWTQLRTLASAGWEIGSHTVTHPHLTSIDDEQLATELVDSRAAVSAALGHECRSIAYPYGDVDARVVAACAEAGYSAAAALPRRPHAQAALEWPRVGVYRKDNAARMALKAARAKRLQRRRPRVAVYTDQLYRRDAEGLSTAQPFALFIAELARHFETLTLVGRLADGDGRAPHALPAALRFTPLPGYEDAASPKAVAGGAVGSLRVWWKLLGDVDVVWLLGPNPLGFGFAALARLRGRSVTLGVRQDLPTYAASRHPNRRAVQLVAQMLERGWQLLARGCPTVVVGAALAEHYKHAPRLLDARISLMSQSQIQAPPRDWDGPLEMLSVGRLDTEKNPLLLADILALLPARVSLTVCGDGPLAEPLRERLDPQRGTLLGSLPRDELLAIYRRAHVLLHVSHTEGVPQVLFEAFASGLPVVATDVGGVAEAAADSALLIAPDDAQAAVAAVTRLLEEPQLREQLVALGLQRAAATTLERSAAEVARLIDAAAYSSSR